MTPGIPTPRANQQLASETILIIPGLSIPVSELRFRFSRSRGPGGQHVQRTETRVELLFDVAHSPSLSDEQRACLQERLAGYLDSGGMLRLVARSTRSQLQNRQEVMARFARLLSVALRPRKRRLPTKPTAASRQRRLEAKRRRAEIKRLRRSRVEEQE